MKKKLNFFSTLFVILTIGFLGCKEFELPAPNAGTQQPPTDNKGGSSYTWPGTAVPRPVEFLGKTQVGSSYDYQFRMHLDGSQIDPNPLDLSSFSIPHVGPQGCAPNNGDVIYHNVPNDAQYYLVKIESGWVYYTIRSAPGHTLKYNISKGSNTGDWFLVYGLPYDDGINNIIVFTTN